MIVTKLMVSNLEKAFPPGGVYGFDTETYGLDYDDRLFSLILSGEQGAYYLNFNKETKMPCLDYSDLKYIAPVFQHSVWCAHNAKFDMHKLDMEGITFGGDVHCTMISERIIRNNYATYTLEEVAKRYGYEKLGDVKEYLIKNGHYSWEDIPGKKQRKRLLHFDRAGADLIYKYGITDALVVRSIGIKQREVLCKMST